MVASPKELDIFHNAVDRVSDLLPHGRRHEAAAGVGILAAAICRVDSPDHAFGFVANKCPELYLPAKDAFRPWQNLAFLGVKGALRQARMHAGIIDSHDGVALSSDHDITDVGTGQHLIKLAAADHEVIPLARQHILETQRNSARVIEGHPLSAAELYEAGDRGAIDLTLSTAHDAKIYALQYPESFNYSGTDYVLGRLASRMIKRRQIEKLDDVLALMGGSSYKAKVLAEIHAAGLSPGGEAAEQAIDMCSQLEDPPQSQCNEVFDRLIESGFQPAIETYRRLLLDKARIMHIRPQSLVALHKAGEEAATDRLLEFAQEGDNFVRVLPWLKEAGLGEYMYDRAAKLHRVKPSGLLLRGMLSVNFTTEQWESLRELPIWGPSLASSNNDLGSLIPYRASDVLMLAEHLSGTEIHLGPQD